MTTDATDEILITLNGDRRGFPAGTTLASLVDSLGLAPERVAVEHNRVIARRDTWASTPVKRDAQIEIVMFVGGG